MGGPYHPSPQQAPEHVGVLPQRVEVTHTIAGDVESVRRAIRSGRPGAEPIGDGTYRWIEHTDINSDTPFRVLARTEPVEDGTKLTLTVTYDARVPYFWWIFDGLTRGSVEQRMRHAARNFESLAAGKVPAPAPARPWWAPPSAITNDQVRIIATISIVLGIVEYGGSLLTQTIDYVAKTYDATNAQLGVVTAVTRVGTLVALVGSALADRLGRRRLLLWAVALVCVATALAGAAPNLATFATLQVLVRGGVNLAFVVAFIAAVEEAPEGGRTYTLAIVGIASGLGFVLGALLLPTADIAPDAWRAMYALGGLGLLFLPSVSGRLTETRRYAALAARRARRGRLSEVFDRRYGRRFVLLGGAAFLLNIFFAPTSQFTNRYLGDERAFSGFGILLLRAATQALPAFAAAYIGGRIAESSGRRPVAVWGLVITAVTSAMFFTLGGPVLWITLAVATASGALAGPSLSAFNTELFPTEVRGTAGAGLTLAGVTGSAVGLLAAGYLAGPLGSIGTATALTCATPFFVAFFLIRRLPEARGMLLDDVSPSKV